MRGKVRVSGDLDAASNAASFSGAAEAPPDIILILADDMPMNLLEYMPAVVEMQADGVTFSNYVVSNAWCCPSRATMFTGKLPHSHTIFRNSTAGGVLGGFAAWRNAGNDAETFATIAETAGYRTVMLGKFLNNYNPNIHARITGWSDWQCSDDAFNGFDYDLGELGSVVHYDSAEEDYATDVLLGFALDAIDTTPITQPLLMVLSVFVPHNPHAEAPRHEGLFTSITYPFTPAFDFRPSASDPAWLQDVPALENGSGDGQTGHFRGQARSLQAVDEAIAAIRAALAAAGRTNAFVIFTSDNGYHMGERSLPLGKQTPYDHDIRIPFVVVGPGVPTDVTVDAFAQNQDLCATFADMAKQPTPSVHQGLSLLPLMRGETPEAWRNVAYIEHKNPNYSSSDPWADPDDGPPGYIAMRSTTGLYIKYITGEIEYHDREADPYELDNTAADLSAERLAAMSAAVDAIQAGTTAAACLAAQTLSGDSLP